MLSVERLGVVLAPKDKEHAKFNAGMVKQGDKVHMLYRWSKSTGVWTDRYTVCRGFCVLRRAYTGRKACI